MKKKYVQSDGGFINSLVNLGDIRLLSKLTAVSHPLRRQALSALFSRYDNEAIKVQQVYLLHWIQVASWWPAKYIQSPVNEPLVALISQYLRFYPASATPINKSYGFLYLAIYHFKTQQDSALVVDEFRLAQIFANQYAECQGVGRDVAKQVWDLVHVHFMQAVNFKYGAWYSRHTVTAEQLIAKHHDKYIKYPVLIAAEYTRVSDLLFRSIPVPALEETVLLAHQSLLNSEFQYLHWLSKINSKKAAQAFRSYFYRQHVLAIDTQSRQYIENYFDLSAIRLLDSRVLFYLLSVINRQQNVFLGIDLTSYSAIYKILFVIYERGFDLQPLLEMNNSFNGRLIFKFPTEILLDKNAYNFIESLQTALGADHTRRLHDVLLPSYEENLASTENSLDLLIFLFDKLEYREIAQVIGLISERQVNSILKEKLNVICQRLLARFEVGDILPITQNCLGIFEQSPNQDLSSVLYLCCGLLSTFNTDMLTRFVDIIIAKELNLDCQLIESMFSACKDNLLKNPVHQALFFQLINNQQQVVLKLASTEDDQMIAKETWFSEAEKIMSLLQLFTHHFSHKTSLVARFNTITQAVPGSWNPHFFRLSRTAPEVMSLSLTEAADTAMENHHMPSDFSSTLNQHISNSY